MYCYLVTQTSEKKTNKTCSTYVLTALVDEYANTCGTTGNTAAAAPVKVMLVLGSLIPAWCVATATTIVHAYAAAA